MATVGTKYPNLQDVASRTKDGKIMTIVEMLEESNEMLEDIPWVEGNLATGHKTTIRTGLPEPTWRKLYQGVQPTKSKTVAVTDTCGMLENYSEIDKEVADLNGNSADFRASEDKAFVHGMSNAMQSAVIYGNIDTDPEKIMGFAPRFNDSTAANGGNIIKGGGSGSDNTSIWLVVWGTNTVHGIYPKGSSAGLKFEDKGQETLTDASGGLYEGYRSHYQWKPGLSIRDHRYIVRIANIDVSELTKDATGSSADLIDLMSQALETVQDLHMGKPVFYCNRKVKSFLRRQISNKANVNLTLDTAGGKHVLAFDGIPVKKVDAILNTEATVS